MITMETKQYYQRPPFEDAFAFWQTLLARHGFSREVLWILDENLFFERDAAADVGFPVILKAAVPGARKIPLPGALKTRRWPGMGS